MLTKQKSAVEGDPKKGWSGVETEAGAEQEKVGLEVKVRELGGDPMRRRKPHICSD